MDYNKFHFTKTEISVGYLWVFFFFFCYCLKKIHTRFKMITLLIVLWFKEKIKQEEKKQENKNSFCLCWHKLKEIVRRKFPNCLGAAIISFSTTSEVSQLSTFSVANLIVFFIYTWLILRQHPFPIRKLILRNKPFFFLLLYKKI